MKLLLTSSGIDNPELEQTFNELVNYRKDFKIALIPTAGDPIEWTQHKKPPMDSTPEITKDVIRLENNKKWQENWKIEYENKGFIVTVVDLKKDPEWIKEELSKADVIMVSGGDGNWLADWAMKSRLNTYLKDLLEKGIVYIGTSAGSCLATPDFGLTWWTPEWVEDHIGLGLVDFCVVPHQKEEDTRSNMKNLIEYKKYLQSVIEYPWKVYSLKDGQAIKVDGDRVEHVGPGEKRFI